MAGKLSNAKQLRAAAKYFQAEKELDKAKFEPFCGVDVVVTGRPRNRCIFALCAYLNPLPFLAEAEIKAVVAELMETHAELLKDKQWNAQGPIMKDGKDVRA